MLLHGPDGVVELPLAYQVHSRLIQTGELARLLAEHLREEAGPALPAAGSRVRLALPLNWGLVCLRLPHTGLEELAQPLHQVAWEIDNNAPEAVEQYYFDFHETAGNEGSETLIVAVRQSLVHFCRTLLDELGLILAEVVPAGESGAGFRLELARAQAHLEALSLERYEPVTPWKRFFVLGGVGLILAAAGILFTLTRPAPEPQVRIPAPAAAGTDSLRAALQPTVADSLPAGRASMVTPAAGPALAAWTALLGELGAGEERLPDYLVLDAAGALVRTERRGEVNLRDVLTRPARATRVGRSGYWLQLDEPLSGGLLAEDPTRPVLRLTLARLGDLAPRLREAPARLMLQRRRTDDSGQTTRWHFGAQDSRGAATGWLVTVFPARPAGPGSVR
ncbi:MAG: hypothetical protein WC326_12160 [Candidatus Delongbacteria bacterium]